MTKKKTTTSSRAQKTLEFPPRVLEVKKDFGKKKDKYFLTLKKLTEAKDLPQENALKKMWLLLEKMEKEKYSLSRNHSDDSWIRYFVTYAAHYSNLPKHYYQPESEKRKIVKDIRRHADQLTKTLQRLNFDYHLAYSIERNILYFRERLEILERRDDSKSEVEQPPFSKILSRLTRHVEAEITGPKTFKIDSKTPARLFIWHMAEYLKNVYGTPLYSVLITATFALHNKAYSEDGIRKILNR